MTPTNRLPRRVPRKALLNLTLIQALPMWYLCDCPRSKERCWRHVLEDGALCAVCENGCASLILEAPADIPVVRIPVVTHCKLDLRPPISDVEVYRSTA
jgi:hypothetical protein